MKFVYNKMEIENLNNINYIKNTNTTRVNYEKTISYIKKENV